MAVVKDTILVGQQINVGVEIGRPDPSKIWAVILGISTVTGLSAAVAGLTLSFLTAVSIIGSSSRVRFAVPALIVAALSFLMFSAHAMDRLQSLRK